MSGQDQRESIQKLDNCISCIKEMPKYLQIPRRVIQELGRVFLKEKKKNAMYPVEQQSKEKSA
jgi:hypothetical protein